MTMTIAWGTVELHPIRYEDKMPATIVGSQFELRIQDKIINGIIGKTLDDQHEYEDYDAILDMYGMSMIMEFVEDDIITLTALSPSSPEELFPHRNYVLDSYRSFLARRARTGNPATN